MYKILLQNSSALDWYKILFGGENLEFLLEVALRSTIMFFVIFFALKILGKRGVQQLSIFELIVILSLGSAAGDASFYKEVGLLPAILVFIMIISLYKIIIFLISNIYSCLKCGHTEQLAKGCTACKTCGTNCWVKAKNDKRIT